MKKAGVPIGLDVRERRFDKRRTTRDVRQGLEFQNASHVVNSSKASGSYHAEPPTPSFGRPRKVRLDPDLI